MFSVKEGLSISMKARKEVIDFIYLFMPRRQTDD